MEICQILEFILIAISINVCKSSRNDYSNNGGTKSGGHNSIHQFTGGYTGGVIPAAIQTRRSVEVRPVNLQSDPIKPAVVLVEAGVIPLTILFRSASSALKVMQQHTPGQVGEQQHTMSEDEPHRLIHEVTKPIIQEVREFITPYRRVVQEIQPVQEDIHTIVSRGEQRSTQNDNKYITQNNNVSPGGGSFETGITSNNFGSNFNGLSGSHQFNADNHESSFKAFPLSNLNYKENNNNNNNYNNHNKPHQESFGSIPSYGTYGKPWSSKSNFVNPKTTNSPVKYGSNSVQKKSSVTFTEPLPLPQSYKNDHVQSIVQSTNSTVETTQKNSDFDDTFEDNNTNYGKKIDVSKVTVKANTKSTSKSPEQTQQELSTKAPEPISKTNHAHSKLNGSKKSLSSPVKNLRQKSLKLKQKPKN